MLAGNMPQSCVASYLWSPSPRIGFELPDLLEAPRIKGAASPVPIKLRRLVGMCISYPSTDSLTVAARHDSCPEALPYAVAAFGLLTAQEFPDRR